MDGLLSFLNANKTDVELLVLMAMFVVIFMYIWIRLVGLYYKIRIPKQMNAIVEEYMKEIRQLRARLKEYERTHRTMV